MEARWKSVLGEVGSSSYHCYLFDGELDSDALEVHDRFELVLVVRGEGEWFIGGQSGRFKSGSVLLLAPGIVHSFRGLGNGAGLEAIVVHFPQAVLPRGLLSIEEARPLKRLLEIAACGLVFEATDSERIRYRMQALLRSKGMFRIARLHVLLELIALQFDSQVVDNKWLGSQVSRVEARLISAKQFIGENCERPLSRSEVATYLGIDGASFSRFFHKETGVVFSDYIANVRVQKAARWLVTRKDFSVAEVAGRSGFKNLSSFNRQFKKRLGMTPLAYRKAADLEPLAP